MTGGEHRPREAAGALEWGSDVVVEMLRRYGIRHVSLNLGSTFRGVLESLLNRADTGVPEVIECLHEEVAVSIAHGYAKVTDRPAVAMVHNVVGTLHATMAIYDAYAARAPVIVLSGTGPMSTTERRPRIDWVHTALIQGNLVRDYVKWDDQPHDASSFPESFVRAYRVSMTDPKGPVYIALDTAWQEARVAQEMRLPDVSAYPVPTPMQADPEAIARVAQMLVDAERPIIIAGRVGTAPENVQRLVELAETGGIPVVDAGGPLNFPNTHPLDATRTDLLSESDLVVLIEVDHPEAALVAVDRYSRATRARVRPHTTVVNIGTSEVWIRSTMLDFGRLYPMKLSVLGAPSLAIPALTRSVSQLLSSRPRAAEIIARRRERCAAAQRAATTSNRRSDAGRSDTSRIETARLLATLSSVLEGEEGWIVAPSEPWAAAGGLAAIRDALRLERPGSIASMAGAGSLGTFVAKTIGVGLAAKERSGFAVGLGSDGDFLYTPTAIWTAVHHKIPVLLIVRDNAGYRGEGEHMTWLARSRGRPTAKMHIATAFDDPPIDLVGLTRAQGGHAEGPVEDPDELAPVLSRAMRAMKSGPTFALVTVR